jgi:hypothetical protein
MTDIARIASTDQPRAPRAMAMASSAPRLPKRAFERSH